eukprot:TRINITY_DN15113_c0_g1_i2.p1 TRINITY_DN15113_c0_g1~~TRINITY_DN15113_c0_g1_i2.p1  ORF type:complete len:216 (-),score=48.11 TRINITY_DN15113_c0_g1_i2:41-688(-)
MCIIKGPHQKKSLNDQVLQIYYSVAPFSGEERRLVSKFDKESSDFADKLRISFEGVIFKDNYQNSEIDIIITVIQGDGNTKSAIFNAVTLALIDAGIGLKDLIVSNSCGILNDQYLIDMTYDESKQADTELIISYLPKYSKVDFILLKSFKVSQKEYEKLLDIAIKQCKSIYYCLLYTSDAADDMQCVDLGGRRIIKKKKQDKHIYQLHISTKKK